MWIEDEDWNSSKTHLFYVGYIRRFVVLFSRDVFCVLNMSVEKL